MSLYGGSTKCTQPRVEWLAGYSLVSRAHVDYSKFLFFLDQVLQGKSYGLTDSIVAIGPLMFKSVLGDKMTSWEAKEYVPGLAKMFTLLIFEMSFC